MALGACANPEKAPPAASGTAGPAASAAAAPAGGPTCSLAKTGYPKVDLGSAVVGFSQSEKEGNPFGIAETQSIRDEAAKLGIATDKLLVTNAQSDLNKQISDIKSMLAQGAQLLVVAPLNSDGLQPALDAAKEKKAPAGRSPSWCSNAGCWTGRSSTASWRRRTSSGRCARRSRRRTRTCWRADVGGSFHLPGEGVPRRRHEALLLRWPSTSPRCCPS
jgi:Periplasmic binding protein domain